MLKHNVTSAAKANLTEAEAMARSALVKECEYALHLDLGSGSTYTGRAVVTFTLDDTVASTFLDFTGVEITTLLVRSHALGAGLAAEW